jgi:hypothetical protein
MLYLNCIIKQCQKMPIKTKRQIRFEILKAEALSRNCETFEDLPPLICGDCTRTCSFGGIQTFTEEKFTELDVCMCSNSTYNNEITYNEIN